MAPRKTGGVATVTRNETRTRSAAKRKREEGQLEKLAPVASPTKVKKARTVADKPVYKTDVALAQSQKTTQSPRRKNASKDKVEVVKEEKRLRPFRKKAPQTYLTKLARAITQRMFVIKRQREETTDGPVETIDIVGTTGNVYQVTVGKVPFCSCPDSKKGNQCKHIVYVLRNVLKAKEHLQYQLAFLSSELRDIFSNAPTPIDNASKDSPGKRKPVEGDCPICFMEFDAATDELVWCKAACGNNIHKTCFQQWVASQRGKEVRCVYCRTPWESDKPDAQSLLETATVGEDGYINVAEAMGLSRERDYSTYHQPWARRRLYPYY